MAILETRPNDPWKIWDFVPKSAFKGHVDKYGYVGDIDYKKGLELRLSRQDQFSKGSLINTKYYETYNPTTKEFSNLVVEVVSNYVYSEGLIEYRDKDWYYYTATDERLWVKGNDRKYYVSPSERRAEGRRRRQNVVDNIEISVVGLLYQFGGFTIAEAIEQGQIINSMYNNQRESYIMDDTNLYLEATSNDTSFDWMDNDISGGQGYTMRMWIVNELTI